MDKPLPDTNRYLTLGTSSFDEYLAKFRLPARMRLYISSYKQAGVAGARHFYGRMESTDDAVITIHLSRPTLLIEREANPQLADRTDAFGSKQEVLTAAKAFGTAYAVEVYLKTWETTVVDGERLADQIETVL